MRRVIGLTLALAGLAACADWPRWSQDLTPGGDVSDAEDPRTLALGGAWASPLSAGSEPTNDSPLTAALVIEAGAGDRHLLTGQLDGIGESCSAGALVTYSDEACPDVEGRRSATGECDYLGDVDFVIVDVVEDGQLCVSARLDGSPPAYRIDTLIFPLADGCNVPLDPMVDGAGDPLGWSVYDDAVEYALRVQAGQRYAVMVAGFANFDREAVAPYNLGLSMVTPPAGDGLSLCPLLPNFITPSSEG